MLNFVSLGALGGALESLLTIGTIKFLPILLLLWILGNITASFFPASIMPGVYKYQVSSPPHSRRSRADRLCASQYMMPFWHNTYACKHIFWGARERLGLNFGVLIGFVLLSPSSLVQ